MTAKPRQFTASQVLAELSAHKWSGNAYAWLYEVRSHTGYKPGERYADALVMSCWPSRGLWLAGVEVKVSRQDFLHELEQPEKSDRIQRFCDHWWLCTSPDVARIDEIPEAWGWIEVVSPRRHAIRKEAPKLPAEQITREFLASALRNSAEASERLATVKVSLRDERDAEREKKLREREDAAFEATNESSILKRRVASLEAELQRANARLEQCAAVANELPGMSHMAIGNLLALSKVFSDWTNLPYWANNLEQIAKRMRETAEMLKPKTEESAA